MNVCARLKTLSEILSEEEQNTLEYAIEHLFRSQGLPSGLTCFLQILDNTPCCRTCMGCRKDYKECSSQEYYEAGKRTLIDLQDAAKHRDVSRSSLQDLRVPECINKIREFMATRHDTEEFASRVQSLMISLDELTLSWMDPRGQERKEETSVKQMIDFLKALIESRIRVPKEIMEQKHSEHEKEMFYLLDKADSPEMEKFAQQNGTTVEDLFRQKQREYQECCLSYQDDLQLAANEFKVQIEKICQKIDEEIVIVIGKIAAYRMELKSNRVHFLKPVMPPIENLSDVNRRCCELFEQLETLETMTFGAEWAQNCHDQVKERICKLLQNIVVIEQQPPPVLKLEGKSTERVKVKVKTGTKPKPNRHSRTKEHTTDESTHESKVFSITVRILGAASFPRLQVAANHLSFSIHSLPNHIEEAMNTEKVIPKDICLCEIKSGERKPDGNAIDTRSNFRRTFDKMKLVRVPKPETSLQRYDEENVTDKKCGIVVSMELASYSPSFIRVLCEPMILTTATVQTCPALGTIFWDAAFSPLERTFYEERTDVAWHEMSREIEKLFHRYIPEHPLTGENLHSIGLRILKKGSEENADRSSMYGRITRKDFMKRPKVENSHWRWLFSCLNLVREDPHDKNWKGLASYWQEGLIMGFVTKSEAERIIGQKQNGTFLIRFRDTGIEKSNRDCPRASLAVVFKTHKGVIHACDKLLAPNIQEQGLGNCLQQLTQFGLRYLYPDRPFDETFKPYINQEATVDGYTNLAKNFMYPCSIDIQDGVEKMEHVSISPGSSDSSDSPPPVQPSMQIHTNQYESISPYTSPQYSGSATEYSDETFQFIANTLNSAYDTNDEDSGYKGSADAKRNMYQWPLPDLDTVPLKDLVRFDSKMNM